MEDINCWELKFESCIYSDKLLNKLTQLNKLVKNPVDLREIKKACYYARKYHGPQMRQSGKPYYSHPIEVAYMLAEFTANEVPELYKYYMIIVSLLHDTIEDSDLTEEMIAEIFDEDIAQQVEGLTRIKPYGKISAEESLNLLYKQKRYDTVLVKIFDRFHNLQTLGAKSPEKARKIIEETVVNFVTLAMYLGIETTEKALINLCFKYLRITHSFNISKQMNFKNKFCPLFLAFQSGLNRANNL